MVFHEMLTSGLALYPSDPADPRFNEFLLEHGWRFVRGETARGLFDLPMAWPAPNLLACSEPMLSFGPVYWVFRAVGLQPAASHQLWLVAMAAINFAAFHAFARRGLGFDRISASAASFLFAFGLPRTAQIGHSQLWPQVYLVLVVAGVHALLSEAASRRARSFAVPAVVAGLALQAWGSLYNAVFMAYVCLATGLLALLHPEWRARALRCVRETHPAGWACVAVAIACVWPLARAYLATATGTADWDAAEIQLLQPRIGSLVYVWSESWFYGWMTTATPLGRLPMPNEQALGIGLLTSAVVGWTLVRERRQPAVVLTAFLFAVLFLPAVMWPGEWTLWGSLHGRLPGLGSLRAIGRMGLLLLIPASVALGAWLQARHAARWPALPLAVAAACLLEQGTRTFYFSKAESERGVARITARIDPSAEAFFYVGTGELPPWITNVQALLAAQRSGVPTINFYSGRAPMDYPLHRKTAPTPERLEEVRRALDQWIRAQHLDRDRVQLIADIDRQPAPVRTSGH